LSCANSTEPRNAIVVRLPRPAGEVLGSTVLLIDADDASRQDLRTLLRSRFCRVEDTATWAGGKWALRWLQPSLVLLNPDRLEQDGLGFIREFRSASPVPIIVISGCRSVEYKIQALDLGVDDYLTKPFAVDELLARMRVALRNVPKRAGHGLLEMGPVRIDLSGREVLVDNEPVHLSPNEFNLLAVLARHAGQVISHGQLFLELRKGKPGKRSTYLRVYIANLRKKLEADPAHPRLLLTKPGVGYKFQNFN